jgi:hypothetical protein
VPVAPSEPSSPFLRLAPPRSDRILFICARLSNKTHFRRFQKSRLFEADL